MSGLRPSGTDPRNVRPVQMLPIEDGQPLPERIPYGTIRNTLLAMGPGQSVTIKHNSRQAFYAWAKLLGISVRINRFPKKSGARVWRMK